jgi:MOSC domain-containing protein YiiM
MNHTKTTNPAKILSICVSKAKIKNYGEHQILTGIFKDPVQGKIALRKLNLDGDQQADLTVHGGKDKALYIYPSEHYPYWKTELPGMELPFGTFGENLTTEGLLESSVCIGDEFRAGTAVIKVTQPRLPCFKLAIKLGRYDIIKRFIKSCKSGIYFSVVEEGMLGAGDDIVKLSSDKHGVTVLEVAALFATRTFEPEQIERILNSNLADQMKESVADLAGIQ